MVRAWHLAVSPHNCGSPGLLSPPLRLGMFSLAALGSRGCRAHPRLPSACWQLSCRPAACIPDASYDYMTTSASDHIRSLTLLPGSASHLRFCKTAHSHVDVRPFIPSLAHAHFLGVAPGCVAGPRSHVPLCPRQQPCLLEDGSSVTNCLLEGAVRLAAGSVIQHCHLQVRGWVGGDPKFSVH